MGRLHCANRRFGLHRQGERIRRRSGDIAQGLIIGDALQVALDGNEYLILLKPDGRELKTKIITRARKQ